MPDRLPSSSRSKPGWKRVLLYAYLGALVLSHVVRWLNVETNPRTDQASITLREAGKHADADESVRFAYVDDGLQDQNRPVLFVLHGSPAASPFMMRLHHALAEYDEFRIVTPDLPGFGGSTRSISDYSAAAHAEYLIQAMDSLNIEAAHLLAYSMSGGVALETWARVPDRIDSISMVSAIGVQELELTGNYHLNHAVHALQLSGLWFISELVPHFGWMDDAMLNVAYARNFFDTDQRPLRNILESYSGPMEIVHGTDDFLVLYEVAEEHYRIVPQSTLRTVEGGGHGMVISIPDSIAAIIRSFMQRVESGKALSRAQADPDRVARASLPLSPTSIPPARGFALVVFFILIVGATLVSEDLACIGAGLMVAKGTLTFTAGAAAAFTGIVLGDVMLYALGYGIGGAVVKRAPLKWMLTEAKLERGASWFRKQGMKAVLFCRFVPGSRLPTFVAAGVLRAPFWPFLLFFLVASLVWTPLIVGLSSLVGQEMFAYYELYEGYALWALAGIVLILYTGIHVALPAMTRKGRRQLRSRWYRITRWEFWPPFVFYIPVVVYVLWLALKHRSLTVFTAANPAIPQGGFVGESKSDILNKLCASSNRVAVFQRIDPSSDGPEQVAEFMRTYGLGFPVVLKPDVGERGEGVEIIQTSDGIDRYFDTPRDTTIVQQFAPGEEFGVFYFRYPGDESGHILSITEKNMISVAGDGKSTLEELIWNDDRANCRAPLHLHVHRDRLNLVLEDGRPFQLVNIGTHCKGALFTDGTPYVTQELMETLDEEIKGMDGFFFGRFDIRTPDRKEFFSGESFLIVELNGVTSEATHIYDPKHSLFNAYHDLFRQWRIAFDIGSINRQKGHTVASLRELFGLIRKHLLT